MRLFITRLLFLFFADDSSVFSRNYLFQDFLDAQRDADVFLYKINSLVNVLNLSNDK
ncbi:type IIL restriction-modification enzyme MmeI [Neisseriaceae bacterium B1]